MMNEELLDSTWNQMERRVKGDGFREGASSGHDSSLTVGFDKGYAEGLRIGLLIGKRKGKEAFETHLKTGDNTPHCTETVGDWCEICSRHPNKAGKTAMHESIESLSFEQLEALQNSRTQQLEEKLTQDLAVSQNAPTDRTCSS